MKSRITQHELVETISGLRDTAKDLKEAASAVPLEGYQETVVAAKTRVLLESAGYLETVAEELLGLLPNTQINIPSK
jgi:hypothetical protein